MVVKSILIMMVLAGCAFIFKSFGKNSSVSETPIDKAWWDGLSEEWKAILLINQNFSKQRSDIYTLQHEYINRLNSKDEDDYSEMNKSLHDLFEMKKFSLGYADFYARALKYKFVVKNEVIDLATLGDLDKIYMVNGPGDLTPLKKFPNLKVLILTDCGIDNTVPIKSQLLNLESLRHLNKLQVLHCSSNALQSIEPIKELVDLRELRLDNSSVTDLSPLKKLINLEVLSVGSKVETAPLIAGLLSLKALYLKGCKKIPDLSKLERLKQLAIEENEMAIIDNDYRIKSIEFLKDLSKLEYLDLDNTSYKGDLALLNSFQYLKAITLPPVSSVTMLEFKKQHNSCVIINAFKYER
ncbi:hypothetical protein BH11BAC3_BH11BAC3_27330 [soil metagenome]